MEEENECASVTRMISSVSACFSVSMCGRSIRCDRRRRGLRTPGGRLGAICAIFSFTRRSPACAFSPVRITTVPPTTSRPSTSSAPRRKSPPISTPSDVPQVDGRALRSISTIFSRSARSSPVRRRAQRIPSRSPRCLSADVQIAAARRHHAHRSATRAARIFCESDFDLILPHESAECSRLRPRPAPHSSW